MEDPVGHLKKLIRDIPDFPKPGVLFRDITPLLADPQGLALSIELLANPFRGKNIDLVVGAESRGFIFGTAVACAISAGFQVVRKPKKLPFKVVSMSYDLEYGTDTLEMHADAVLPGPARADRRRRPRHRRHDEGLHRPRETLGGEVAGVAVMIELAFLKGRAKVAPHDVHSIVRYTGAE
jgi:adenine phosphoribosyltransferase